MLRSRPSILLFACSASACYAPDLPADPAVGSTSTSATVPSTGGDPAPTQGGDSSSGVTTADPSTPGMLTDPDPTSATSTTSPPDPTVDTMTTTSTTDVTASTSATDGLCDDAPGQPNDSVCGDKRGCGCASGKCFVMPVIGGWCGECLDDDDCSPGGCTIPNPLSDMGSRCNKGEPGAGCESDAVCSDPQHPHCGVVLQAANIYTLATCGACVSNLDCPPAAHNCTPIYDIPKLTFFECMSDDVVPNGGGCNLADNGQGEPIGNDVCASGRCGMTTWMGLMKIGVCGECNSNAECPGYAPNCQSAKVDPDGVLVPASCV